MHVQRKVKYVPKESSKQVQGVGLMKVLGVKSIEILVEIFSFYQKMVSTPFCQIFRSDKWNLREE